MTLRWLRDMRNSINYTSAAADIKLSFNVACQLIPTTTLVIPSIFCNIMPTLNLNYKFNEYS